MSVCHKGPTAVCSQCTRASFLSARFSLCAYAGVHMCTYMHAVEVRGHPQLSSSGTTYMYLFIFESGSFSGLELAKYRLGWPAREQQGRASF